MSSFQCEIPLFVKVLLQQNDFTCTEQYSGSVAPCSLYFGHLQWPQQAGREVTSWTLEELLGGLVQWSVMGLRVGGLLVPVCIIADSSVFPLWEWTIQNDWFILWMWFCEFACKMWNWISMWTWCIQWRHNNTRCKYDLLIINVTQIQGGARCKGGHGLFDSKSLGTYFDVAHSISITIEEDSVWVPSVWIVYSS